jgi:hypothetical protein
MTTQEPKLKNDNSAFPEVLPDVIEDYAHCDHHPISTNTIPSSESSDPGYVDASPTSSSTFLDQGNMLPTTSKPTQYQYCFPNRATLKIAVDSYIFENCAIITNCTTHNQYGEIGTWCVKLVTDMRCMFLLASSFKSDISRWDVSSV